MTLSQPSRINFHESIKLSAPRAPLSFLSPLESFSHCALTARSWPPLPSQRSRSRRRALREQTIIKSPSKPVFSLQRRMTWIQKKVAVGLLFGSGSDYPREKLNRTWSSVKSAAKPYQPKQTVDTWHVCHCLQQVKLAKSTLYEEKKKHTPDNK